MYKMLLVEAESNVRLALKTGVNWQEHGFHEILETNNGGKALEIIKSHNDIDIVITDINIPGMNGIKLIEETKKFNKDIQFLVLSACDDYNFIRKAFKIGANDYALKTEMDIEKILQIVLNIVNTPKKIKDVKKEKINSEKIKGMLLFGNLKKQDLKEGGLKLYGSWYVCSYIIIDNFNMIRSRYSNKESKDFISSFKNTIMQVFNRINNGEILVISPNEYVIFLSFEDDSSEILNNRLRYILREIRYVLFSSLNIDITVGVSGFINKVEETNILFYEARRNANMRFVFGKGKEIFSEQVEALNEIRQNKNNDLTQQIIREMNKSNGLFKAIDELNEERSLEEMRKILNTQELYFNSLDNGYIYYLEIVVMMVQYVIKDEDDNLEDIVGRKIDLYNEIIRFETIMEVENWILDILIKIISYLKRSKQRESAVVREAKKYILNNYAEKITLESVSKKVGFSKVYFSKIFTEEVGNNFITYLTNVRVKNAKKLLDETDMKMYEICEKVGYNNIEHFSRTFKKLVGLSPVQYKNKKYLNSNTTKTYVY